MMATETNYNDATSTPTLCLNTSTKSALRNAIQAKLRTSKNVEESMSALPKNAEVPMSLSQNSDVPMHMMPKKNSEGCMSVPFANTNPTTLCDKKELDEDTDSNDELDQYDKMSDDNKDSASGVPIEERRLRNRLAARKCREKRKQRIVSLEKICSTLEGRISILQDEVRGYQMQKASLTNALENHICVAYSPKRDII